MCDCREGAPYAGEVGDHGADDALGFSAREVGEELWLAERVLLLQRLHFVSCPRRLSCGRDEE
jgi:hypothetical protein